MSRDKTSQFASHRGRWFKRLGLTLTSGSVLVGFYCVYAMFLRPLVESPLGQRHQHAEKFWAPPRPRQGEEMANRYLASQPWAAKAKFILRTEEAFIYFEEYDELEEDEALRLMPFAMIYMKKDIKPDEEPITVISDSAYVKFANKFRLTSPNAGRVVSGALEGAVKIHGNNGLEVVGRNFVFSEKHMRLWSDSHVDFAYGPHKGNGHSLQVELIPDEEARAKEKLAVKGFKSVRLRRNVSMDLEFRDGESDDLLGGDPSKETQPVAGKNQPAEVPAKAKPKEPTIVKVRSAGSFEFVVATNVATFEDEVRVYQPTDPGKYNSLQSDLMTLYFEPKPKAQPNATPKTAPNQPASTDPFAQPEAEPQTAQAESKDSFRSVDTNLSFRRLVALGQNVILRSETNDLIAMMNQLDYDAQAKLAKLTSRSMVRVLQKQSEMQCPTIELLHQDRGRVSNVWAKGTGWLQSLDEKTGKLAFAAQWKKELRKLPDPRTGLDLIELYSEALVRQPEEQFGLAADFMRLWLEPNEAPKAKLPASRSNAPVAAKPVEPVAINTSLADVKPEATSTKDSADQEDNDTNRTNRLQPKQLLAEKNVAILTPDLQGQSQRLEVWFEPAPPSAMVETAEAKRSRENLQPVIKQTPGQTVSVHSTAHPNIIAATQTRPANQIPLAPAPTESPGTADEKTSSTEQDQTKTGEDKSKKKKEDGPIEIISDLIRVKVLTFAEKRKNEVSEVWTEGRVQVRQLHGPEELPLHMTGETLHVVNRAKDDQLMTLWGSPAHVRDRGMHIEGREIFLDRVENQSRVNGSGLLQLPVKRSLDGEVLAEPKLLDIKWAEQMTFDGLNAKFFGNVRAELNNDDMRSNMRCEEMDVVLSKRISFSESRSSQEPKGPSAEVSRVFCKDGVEFDSYKYEESKLSEVRRGRFAEFAINQTTGDTRGQGPGWIKVWRRGRGKRAALTPNASVKANRALKPDSAEWEYMRIDFAGTADGNMKQKFNTFKDQVKIIYGPVERSLMVIPPDNLPKDAGWMQCENLRITQNEPKSKEEKGFIDLLATGNVELEGRSFNARADSISYDESKGLYTLRSQGRQKATIWRQTQVGGDMSRADAQLMHFIPARNVLKLDQATGLEGVN